MSVSANKIVANRVKGQSKAQQNSDMKRINPNSVKHDQSVVKTNSVVIRTHRCTVLVLDCKDM